ncbi:MAG: hypothetical protein HY661_07565 [Betaproteobacteria bacterium]|nr:hypothetical protein [Betaproteobacteria bacterium]
MIRIRGGAGLGDAIYLRPICEHFVRAGKEVIALSGFPGVFTGSGASVEPFRRDRVDLVAHYTSGKTNPATTIWQDVCAQALVEVPLAFTWEIQNRALIDRLKAKAAGRPLILVHGGREPMGRRDGFGNELLPNEQAFGAVLSSLHDCVLVQVGKDQQIYPLRADISLNGSTSVADLLDIAAICAGVVAQCSFAVPLAEVFDKPLLVAWAARGLASREQFIRTVTPAKMLSKPSSHFVMDDWPVQQLQEAARAFRKLF